MPIAVLSPEAAAAIAAGEVIERPASVVKELVENALDAGATAITVEVEGGGLSLIRVTDNGAGMPPEELSLAVQRHATSKLRSADDLSRVATLGFRGEGLPSIAAAADLSIRSRQASAQAGAVLEVRAGVAAAPRPVAAPEGTSVSVRRLFERQPARRNFLRAAGAETAQIGTLLSQFALAYPGVRFSLLVDGRRALETPGSGDVREAAVSVYGAGAAARLLPLERSAGALRIGGLVSPPDLTRPSRTGIFIAVNGRPVRSPRLVYAVESGYETLLGARRYPLAAIDLRLPPEEVDVNVHPAKTEVRFRDERAIFGAVHSAVRRVVIEEAPVPELRLGVGLTPSAAPEAPPVPPDEGPAAPLPLWQAPATERAEGGDGSRPFAAALPLLRVLGQMGTTYIIAEGPDGMYLLDQHAAHERVLYERILARMAAGAPEVQGLLEPALLEMTAAQADAFSRAEEELAAAGFEVEQFGGRVLAVRSVPAVLAGRDAAAAVAELLDQLAAPDTERAPSRVPMTLACHAAVRAGMTLGQEEMRELVRLLERCDSPRTCPHGRPTMMHLSADLLDREFRRGR